MQDALLLAPKRVELRERRGRVRTQHRPRSRKIGLGHPADRAPRDAEQVADPLLRTGDALAELLDDLPLGPDGGEVTLTAREAYALACAFEQDRPMFPGLTDGRDFDEKLRAFDEAVVRARDGEPGALLEGP